MSKRTRSDSPDKACTKVGCERPLRARGLCASHYNQAHQPNRHKTRLANCAYCGVEIVTRPGGGRKYGPVCSTKCKTWLSTPYCVLPDDHWARWYGKASAWTPPVIRTKPQPQGCAWCGETFMAKRATHTMCSERCSTRAKKTRRRAREHEATGTYTWAEVMRIWIDIGKVCAYCNQETASIEPDHVIPLSKSGSNSITNIVPSCGQCNGDKRDLLLTEWYEDRSRRGLPARSLHPSIKHLTHALLTA
jgi:predicted nucleic acid-binding Zn ribbon protein